MLIALIDDGIDASAFHGIRLRDDLEVRSDGSVAKRGPGDAVITDHGSTCAGIIARYAPDAEFCSIRIFNDEKLRSPCGSLVAALRYCFGSRVPIIHMSVGTSLLSDYREIRAIVAKLLHQRQVVIAAHSNKNNWSIPACLAGVFGVTADERMKDSEYDAPALHAPNGSFRASSRHILSGAPAHETQVANSYAAPTITAAVHNAISKHEAFSLTIPQIYKMVAGASLNQPFFHAPDFIEEAYIINPERYPLLKRHLFFNCVQEVTAPEGIQGLADRKNDVVYIPSHSDTANDKASDFLCKERGTYENLLYCGVPANGGMRTDKLIWSERPVAAAARNVAEVTETVECPIVNIAGHGHAPVDLLCRLRDLFLLDGYQCACLSDYPLAYLYGIDSIPHGVWREQAISYACSRYGPDIILCCFQEIQHDPVLSNDEYSIYIPGETKEFGSQKGGCITPAWNYVIQNMEEQGVLSLYSDIVAFFD